MLFGPWFLVILCAEFYSPLLVNSIEALHSKSSKPERPVVDNQYEYASQINDSRFPFNIWTRRNILIIFYWHEV